MRCAGIQSCMELDFSRGLARLGFFLQIHRGDLLRYLQRAGWLVVERIPIPRPRYALATHSISRLPIPTPWKSGRQTARCHRYRFLRIWCGLTMIDWNAAGVPSTNATKALAALLKVSLK